MRNILAGGALMFSDPNTPTRVGELVEQAYEIYEIVSPRVGMRVFVNSEKRSYVVTSLTSKVVGGVEVPDAAVEAFEPVGATEVVWDNTDELSNMNSFVDAGDYEIHGEHTRDNDNLPIANTGGGHTFSARLTVLDSSIGGNVPGINNDDKCITQILSLCNRLGQGEVYVRTGKGSRHSKLTWEKWSTLQRNVYVGRVDSLDGFIDNGIYSGVFAVDYTALTFVLVVINDYVVGVAPRRVSQFLYALGKVDGAVTFTYRTRTGEDDWSEWKIVNDEEIGWLIRDKIKEVVDGVDPDRIDSIKDIIAWIENHGDVESIINEIKKNGTAIINETSRAQKVEYNLSNDIKSVKDNALQYNKIGFSSYADKVELYARNVSDNAAKYAEIPSATTEKAGVMSAKDKVALDFIPKEIEKIKDGDTIVGQAREIHSRNGKTVTDSFLARTTAGSGTIGDGVASLKSVGGNIVKNNNNVQSFIGSFSYQDDIITALPYSNGIVQLFVSPTNDYNNRSESFTTTSGHIYYNSCYIKANDELADVFVGKSNNGFDYVPNKAQLVRTTDWQHASFCLQSNGSNYFHYSIGAKNATNPLYIKNILHIDLTEMFGAGNEPTKEECDKLFGTMDALPQGLSIANPTEFKSTGFNHFNPDNVLEGKAIVDNAIVSGDKKIAVIPCLPCKVGVGENNGYCIHGDFGDDIKVYLTPLNPMEVDGELYMHELTKDATTDTYVPLIKGYMLVEVPTTANLCAHFLWSEDKCERDSYEPYFESKVELPTIPQMSEWGLAGIQSRGTLAADTIDFEREVYVKRIGSVDLGSFSSWIVTPNYAQLYFSKMKPSSTRSNILCNELTVVANKNHEDTINSITTLANNPTVIVNLGLPTTATKEDYKKALSGKILYYELAEPEEYPLSKVDNNYISSDYGVEQFDGGVPCNANNLYYMRSLAGETRNFLDRLYDNTDKTDAKEVADYITNGIEGNKELAANAPNLALRALFIAAGAEYNDTDNHIVKDTPWKDYVDSTDYKAQWDLDVITGSVQTLTYGGKTYEYVDDNDTWKIIARVGDKLIWDDTKVIHRKGYYYLNGLGDITEEQMLRIYDAGRIDSLNADTKYVERPIITTLRSFTTGGESSGISFYYGCTSSTALKVLMLRPREYVWFSKLTGALSMCVNLRYIYPILRLSYISSNNNVIDSFYRCNNLVCCHFSALKVNMNMKDSPLLSKKSILYTIQNANPTSAIAITLHHDAYARLAADEDIINALTTKNAALTGSGKISLVCATHSEEITPNA